MDFEFNFEFSSIEKSRENEEGQNFGKTEISNFYFDFVIKLELQLSSIGKSREKIGGKTDNNLLSFPSSDFEFTFPRSNRRIISRNCNVAKRVVLIGRAKLAPFELSNVPPWTPYKYILKWMLT